MLTVFLVLPFSQHQASREQALVASKSRAAISSPVGQPGEAGRRGPLADAAAALPTLSNPHSQLRGERVDGADAAGFLAATPASAARGTSASTGAIGHNDVVVTIDSDSSDVEDQSPKATQEKAFADRHRAPPVSAVAPRSPISAAGAENKSVTLWDSDEEHAQRPSTVVLPAAQQEIISIHPDIDADDEAPPASAAENTTANAADVDTATAPAKREGDYVVAAEMEIAGAPSEPAIAEKSAFAGDATHRASAVAREDEKTLAETDTAGTDGAGQVDSPDGVSRSLTLSADGAVPAGDDVLASASPPTDSVTAAGVAPGGAVQIRTAEHEITTSVLCGLHSPTDTSMADAAADGAAGNVTHECNNSTAIEAVASAPSPPRPGDETRTDAKSRSASPASLTVATATATEAAAAAVHSGNAQQGIALQDIGKQSPEPKRRKAQDQAAYDSEPHSSTSALAHKPLMFASRPAVTRASPPSPTASESNPCFSPLDSGIASSVAKDSPLIYDSVHRVPVPSKPRWTPPASVPKLPSAFGASAAAKSGSSDLGRASVGSAETAPSTPSFSAVQLRPVASKLSAMHWLAASPQTPKSAPLRQIDGPSSALHDSSLGDASADFCPPEGMDQDLYQWLCQIKLTALSRPLMMAGVASLADLAFAVKHKLLTRDTLVSADAKLIQAARLIEMAKSLQVPVC